ncbi:MAG TPA: hypothetical protein VGB30_15060 [bacterium]|jgi:hypothetical protein
MHRAAIILFIILICGCSGKNSPVTVPMMDESRSTSNSSHSVLSSGFMYLDEVSGTIEIVPDRIASSHYNVRKFAEEAPCNDCLHIENFTIIPDDQILLDVVLTHPFPGLDQFTGFDVRLIVIFNGSEDWPNFGLKASNFGLGDGQVLNPDGYTSLFNPVDFPPGSMPLPIMEYSKGKLAPNVSLNATLNAYLAFNSESDRRIFGTTESSSVHLEMIRPQGPLYFGYVIDASWIPPDKTLTGDPDIVDVPGDFPVTANAQEAYMVSTYAGFGMLDNGDGISELYVDVFDWQGDGDMAKVQIEAPDIFPGLKGLTVSVVSDDWVRFAGEIKNEYIAGVGLYPYLVEVRDVEDENDPMPLRSYQFGTLSVGHYEEVIDYPPELITEIVDVFHSPFCAKLDPVDQKVYVDSTQLAPVWDTSIRSIDKNDMASDAFAKANMGAFLGMSESDRKLISPDFFTSSGNVDVYDLDGGPEEHFFIPVDPELGIAFMSDGELFADLSIAVVCDSVADNLVVFDYTDPGTEYVVIPTTAYPFTLEADYENHRLFVYCFGGIDPPEPPTIEVWDVETWELITSFATDSGTPPFWSDLDYYPEKGKLIFGSSTDSIEVWNSETYEHIATIPTGLGEVAGVDHMNGFFYVSITTGFLQVYDADTLELKWEIPCGVQPLMLCCNEELSKIYVPDIDGQSVLIFQH